MGHEHVLFSTPQLTTPGASTLSARSMMMMNPTRAGLGATD